MEPLVSIVVPVYGVEAYLDRCVESLVRQTYPHLEIILVEDGSPDRCAALCDAWAAKDSRIAVVHKENAGLGMARNTGIEHISGAYTLFVDSDDYLGETAVERSVALAEQTGAELVMFGRSDVFPDGTVRPKPMRTDVCYFEAEQVRQDILPGLFTYHRGIGISAWGKLIATRVLLDNEIRFLSERDYLVEDACYTLELFSHVASVAILGEHLYFYYKNDKSLSRTYKKDYQRLNDRLLQKGLSLCQAYGLPPQVQRAFCARYRIFAIAGMKLVIGSSLPKAQRRAELRQVFRDPMLHRMAAEELLSTDSRSQRVFWRLFRWRLYPLCYGMLWYKTFKKR